MKWYKNLYLGENIAPKARQIVNKIKKKRLTPDVYVIALASNSQNLLDIIPTWELLQLGYPTDNVRIIGLAQGKQEALELVTSIVDEVYQKTGNVKLQEYLKQMFFDEKWRGQA
ncbi:MAG: hypothetical protein IJ419_13900 [Agathobacter sp.]|nr:hypothetical protein [Agathobacter sp.]